MKTISVFAFSAIFLLFTSCSQLGNPATDSSTLGQQRSERSGSGQLQSAQQKMDAEVDNVRLDIPNKAGMTAGEVKQGDIVPSGYNASLYAITVELVTSFNAERKVEVVFFLKKDGTISKKRTVTITGFKTSSSAPTAQEVINAEVDKVTVDVTGRETITADELSTNKNKITALGFNSAYAIKYTAIKGNVEKREVEITFRLEKDSLHSKTRTVMVKGFKQRVLAPGTVAITGEELLQLFHLTETQITASAAAKKIAAAQSKTVGSFSFETAQAVAYDDKEGTFTVKVKGTKGNKPFAKTVTVTSFTHPYAGTRLGGLEYQNGSVLVFDKAIEENMPLKTFLEKAKAAEGIGFASFTYMLINENGSRNGETVKVGKHSDYKLTARLTENNDGTIKVLADYALQYHILTSGGTETVEEAFVSSSTVKEKALYFSKDDVFQYLINKTDDSIITVDSSKFASEYYAFARALNATPLKLLNDAHLQPIIDRYGSDGGHLNKMRIHVALYEPRNYGIEADDYTGTLKIKYCIATEDQVDKMFSGESLYGSDAIKAIKDAQASGFKTVTQEDAKTFFQFELKGATGGGWKSKRFQTYPFLRKLDGMGKRYDVFQLQNPLPLKQKVSSSYYLEVNGQGPENVFALDEPKFFSKCSNGAHILIEYIYFDKTPGSDTLKICMKFMGKGEEIIQEVKPK